jgi:uncharacterized protein
VEGLANVTLVFLAAITAGAMNAVVGAGTIITFPTLLAIGVPPVTANVSNTVGLVPGGLAGAYAFRATLRERGPLLRRLVVASSIGGLTGGGLLLFLPAEAFELVIPPLLVLSGILAAIQPRVTAWVALRRQRAADAAPADAPVVQPGFSATPPLLAAVAATGIYGGYFGAAQGVILLALLGVFFAGDLTAANGTKNVLASVANIVSALLFIVLADVDWAIAGVIAVGSTIGGGLGGRYGRRLRPGPLRAVVVVVAFTAAAWQLLR